LWGYISVKSITMKKMLLLAAAFSVFACSDDDTDNNNYGIQNPYTGEVNGDWKTIYAGFDDMAYSLDCDNDSQFEGNYYYRFNTNNTVDVYYNCDIEGPVDDEVPFTTGTYNTTGNVFTLNILGQEGKAHMIDNLDNNELILRFTIGSGGLFYGHDIGIEKQ
jgi:hypothetical protein